MHIDTTADITRGKRSAVSRHGHRDLLEFRRNQAIAQVSHELRNCLGAVGNAMRILDIEALEESGRRQARMIVDRQLGQMARLVDDLIDTSLIRSGRLRLQRARVDLRTPLGHTLEAVEFEIQRRHHRLRIAMPASPVWIYGDVSRLEQVFMNLLVNAAKYTHMGGAIQVSLERLEHEAVVHVRDSGIGISSELLPRVFEPYVQAKSRQDGGTGGIGLGLPLVRSLVQRHGGRVEAASDGLGRGSVFSVRLPLAAARH